LFEKTKLDDSFANNDLDVAYNEFVKKVSEDIETLSFNTAISQMMIFINKCYQYESINKDYLKGFAVVLSCFAPHLAEELWHKYLSMDSFIINDK
jgi:leucyl-tRNA synthetase